MRRDSRRKQDNLSKNKIIISASIALIVIIIATITIVGHGGQDDNIESKLSSDKIATLVPNNEIENTQSASSALGKSIEEAEMEENIVKNSISSNSINENVIKEKTSENTTKASSSRPKSNTNTTKATKITKEASSEVKKEITFAKPVKGEIVKDYSKDNLIYSNTLKEWVTHLGVDIKAEKTSVVKASAGGTVKSIKNDPRYGLTVVINHGDGLQSVYSNLLTSEFVVEGEKVKQGQSIGTVGNTAAFEIADEPHLHFEILKNNIQVDPTIYIK